jgi:Transposase DDE domain
MKVNAINYTQHLITSQVNYTCSYFGDRVEEISGDKIERYLKSTKLTPRMLWDKTCLDIHYSPNGCLIVDDTVLDHNSSSAIEIVRKQWSGNQHKVIRGIGLVALVYYNPELDRTWLIDYRLFDPETDGLKKTDHAVEMYQNVVYHKQDKVLKETPNKPFTFKYVLFDAAYATKKFLVEIDNTGNKYLCNMKSNRKCWEVGKDYSNTDNKLHNKPESFRDMDWNSPQGKIDLQNGKTIRLKDFVSNSHLKLFKITVSKDRTDFIVTNDLSINSPTIVESVNGMRWNIESFNREIKQTTGIEACQCRKARSQRTHINLALRAWIFLKQQATKLQTTVYQLKQSQLDNYYKKTMKNPTLRFEW